MLPNFLVIGAPKCGTTSICELLGQHPQIFMSTPKEPRFFSHEDIYANGMSWYESLFDGAAGAKAIGEGSTSYGTSTRGEISAMRIHDHLPRAKLIYCVRHPLERVESIWMEQHHAKTQTTGPNFSEGSVSRDFNRDVLEHPGFLQTSSYWRCIQTFRERFPDDQILIVFLEDFRVAPGQELARCFRFLAVDADVVIRESDRPRNPSSEKMRERPVYSLIKHLPGFRSVGKNAPSGLKRILTPLMHERAKGRPVWSPTVRARALEQIRDDARRFLSYCDKPESFWDLR